jgi:hypothetical protein
MSATQLHERDSLDDPRDLRRRAIAIEVENEALRARVVALEAELPKLRALLPPKPPQGWICTKRAAAVAHCSASAIYIWARRGRIRSVKLAGRVYVDSASLPARVK